ncbi:MAG: ubiquitin-like small modifier protein 1 [Caldilineaceae bacterium]
MRVKVFATLRPIVGSAEVPTEVLAGQTVGVLVDEMVTRWPELRAEMLDSNGGLLRRIQIFVNGRSVRYLDGLNTVIGENDNITIFPPVGGG